MIFNQSCWTLSGPQQYVYSIHPWEIWINNFTAGCILEHPGLHVYYSTISYTKQLMVVFCKTQDYMYTILLYPTLYSWWLYFGTPWIILLYPTLYSWWLYFVKPRITCIIFYYILHYTADGCILEHPGLLFCILHYTADGCILEHPGLYYSTVSYTIQLMVVFWNTLDYTILLYPTLYSFVTYISDFVS